MKVGEYNQAFLSHALPFSAACLSPSPLLQLSTINLALELLFFFFFEGGWLPGWLGDWVGGDPHSRFAFREVGKAAWQDPIYWGGGGGWRGGAWRRGKKLSDICCDRQAKCGLATSYYSR